MFVYTMEPRFSDTDALGHISNTAYPVWFEQARSPVFALFHPSFEVSTWPLIVARIEIDYLAQGYWNTEVEIKTGISKVGNSSCHIIQEAWQNQKLIAKGTTVMIYFDYQQQKSQPIPADLKKKLLSHSLNFIRT